MSPEQKQSELMKVKGVSPEQIKQYLRSLGVNEDMVNSIMSSNQDNNFENVDGNNKLPQHRKFNY